MTTHDTKAIRAQMDALTGFTAGPWNADLGETTYRVKADGMNIATANFVTLLDRIPTDQDVIEQLSAENRYLRQQIEELRRSSDRLAALTWVQPQNMPTGWD